jgi:NAD(P)-dependent dehydrogenase (short-subunit alcohol dehydrogenase family)
MNERRVVVVTGASAGVGRATAAAFAAEGASVGLLARGRDGLEAARRDVEDAGHGFTESVRCELLHEGSDVHVTMVQLPALNPPQVQWGRSRMPRTPQPVPPIFQPELAADAIVFASRAGRREVQVAGSTVVSILGDKLAAPLADRYLARTGYETQQTEEPAEPERPDNLFQALPGDWGAHGRSTRGRVRRASSSGRPDIAVRWPVWR